MTADPEIVRITLPTPFPIGLVNVFLIKTDPPILVDAGSRVEGAYERLEARLKEHGLAVRDLGGVLLTHGHLDHAGLVADIVRESGAEVYAHPYVVEQYADYHRGAEEGLEFLIVVMRQSGVPADTIEHIRNLRLGLEGFAAQVAIQHPVEDGDVVAGFTAYHVPGHSAADIVFYDAVRRIAFTGDHVLKKVSPNPLIRKPRQGQRREKCLVEYQHSLLRTRALDIETCYAGHGAPFTGHREVIDDLLERHARRTAEAAEILRLGPLTPYELALKLFPRIDAKVLHLGLSVSLGLLDVLEERGQAKSEERDGVVYYSRLVA